MNIEAMDGILSQIFRKPETVHEFGNDQDCRNCGDEWDDITDGYCQWCGSDNTYAAGYSPMCIETQYKCRDCNRETWIDDVEVAQ